jgi:hypothetical protein
MLLYCWLNVSLCLLWIDYCRILAACLDLSTGLSENRELTVPPLTPPYEGSTCDMKIYLEVIVAVDQSALSGW